ncbi:MAG: RNA polymerase sigma factor [Minisyncoccota bacterium]
MARPYEAAFLEAFDEYADALFRHASFRLSNPERVKDLTQDTFLKAWDYVHAGNEIHNWKSFLYRILNNLIIDEYRRKKEESLDAILDDSPTQANSAVAVGSRAEKEAELDDALLIERIRAFIPKLPETYRVTLTLRYIDGFSIKEIADMLGVSENVASVRTHRGLAQLKKLCGSIATPYEK